MKIAAGQFKAQCLKIMDNVYKRNEEVIITKYGKPIAKLVPINEEEKFKAPLYGALEGLISISGDIIGSMGEKWNTDK